MLSSRVFASLATFAILASAPGCGRESEQPAVRQAPAQAQQLPKAQPTEARPAKVAPEKPAAAPAEKPEPFEIRVRRGEKLSDIARWSGKSRAELERESGLPPGGAVPVNTRVVLQLTPAKAATFMEARLAALGERSLTAEIGRRAERPLATDAEREREDVTIRVRRNEMLGLYAEWAGVSLAEIRAANPSLRGDRLSLRQKLTIPVPSGRRLDFEEARDAWHNPPEPDKPEPTKPAPTKPEPTKPTPTKPEAVTPPTAPPAPAEGPACARTYKLRHGDIVWLLAKRWGIRVKDIRVCNPGVNLDRISAGKVLKVPDAANIPE